jgi:F420-non-reducing hydrogenase iron-sulfur subunit
VRVIRLMCSGRLDPQFVLAALRQGADGVLVGGCPAGDCHFQDGNIKCRRRFELLLRLLAQLGIEPERLRLEWISASEAEKLRDVVEEMVKRLKELGPLRLEPLPRFEGLAPGDPSPAAVAAEGAPP